MQDSLSKAFRDKTILVTGHTGFKGSWLTIWLQELGAKVIGYSLEPATTPSHFGITKLEPAMTHIVGDLRDFEKLSQVITDHRPDLIFHLGAQSIVMHSFSNPRETFDVNAGGSVNLLEACRGKDFIKGVVLVTTDKCYENKEWVWGYREVDPLGGNDPYSASKAMAEIAAASYRKSFFSESTPIATARAGNVVGGGDFSEFRLIPDCMRALMQNETIKLRNKNSTRPWLHVLDPLHGYLMLAEKLLTEGQSFAEAWNFGPLEHQGITTQKLIEEAIAQWGEGSFEDTPNSCVHREMTTLKLNSDKAANRLNWAPVYNWKMALADTVEWFKTYEKYCENPRSIDMREVSVNHIHAFYLFKEKKHEIYSNAP